MAPHNHGGGGISGMDMSGGMDMATAGMFMPLNKSISHIFWYIITAIVAIGLIGNILCKVESHLRQVHHQMRNKD
jgi:hypothetical protein